jgi:hypothetical protein
MADLKELFKNVKHHDLDQDSIPRQYINLQTYAASYFHLAPKKLPKLKTTVERLKIPEPYPFHNALHDAYYTAQILTEEERSMIFLAYKMGKTGQFLN